VTLETDSKTSRFDGSAFSWHRLPHVPSSVEVICEQNGGSIALHFFELIEVD
jgi:hypothetical protein